MACTNNHRPRIDLIEYTPDRRAFQISTVEPITLTLRSLYYPDWRAQVDGQPATTFSSTPLGLFPFRCPPAHIGFTFTARIYHREFWGA